MTFIYVLSMYLVDFFDAKDQDMFESRRVWIPMDLILTLSFGAYYVVVWYRDRSSESSLD